jgi:hypothetical protein
MTTLRGISQLSDCLLTHMLLAYWRKLLVRRWEWTVETVECAGCGGRSRRRDMVECVEGNHDNLTHFHGDRLCRGCADGAGVAY